MSLDYGKNKVLELLSSREQKQVEKNRWNCMQVEVSKGGIWVRECDCDNREDNER
jgi:hypothetical protein